jgi:hypothetical protein
MGRMTMSDFPLTDGGFDIRRLSTTLNDCSPEQAYMFGWNDAIGRGQYYYATWYDKEDPTIPLKTHETLEHYYRMGYEDARDGD